MMDEERTSWQSPAMTVWAIRAFFLLISAGLGWIISDTLKRPDGQPLFEPYYTILGVVALYGIVVILEILLGSISNISALVFGVMVGVVLGHFGYSLAILNLSPEAQQVYGVPVKLLLISMFSYLSVVLIFKTRHRFNFIIPYVEFHRQTRGATAVVLDSSAIIDGRIEDVLATGAVDVPVVAPRFVIEEIQQIADSSDRLRRARGRRGLDVLARIQSMPNIEVRIEDVPMLGSEPVDARLVRFASGLGARLATTDFNLQKVASLNNVKVLNLNELAAALRPSVMPGEELQIQLVREGEEPGQAVGFLDDGTMVIAEDGKRYIGQEVALSVGRILQISSGRMIFGRVKRASQAD